MADNYVKLEKLLEEISENRDSLHEMVVDIQEFKKHMHTVLPDTKDFRNKFVWEEKMKNIASILGVELSIRKEIGDSLKDEITLRNKVLEGELDGDDDRSMVAKLAKMIESGQIEVSDDIEETEETENEE